MTTTPEPDESIIFSDYIEDPGNPFGTFYPPVIRKFLYHLNEFLLYLWGFTFPCIVPLSFIGIFVNLLHLVVLTRKSMMNNSINLILAVLAVNDIFGFLFVLREKAVISLPFYDLDCTPNGGLFNDIIRLSLDTTRSFCSRNTSWLVILMAAIRTFYITNSDSSRFSSLTKMKIGAYGILLVLLVSFGVAMLVPLPYFIDRDLWESDKDTIWIPNDRCSEEVKNMNISVHNLNFPQQDRRQISIINGITITIIPSICYPILTFFLIKGLRKANWNRKKLGKQENGRDRSTAIVIGTTVSFMIAEIPRSISYFTEESKHIGFVFLSIYVSEVFSFLTYFNACIHCVICFSLSSVYRKTVYDLLRIRKKKCEPHKIHDVLATTEFRRSVEIHSSASNHSLNSIKVHHK